MNILIKAGIAGFGLLWTAQAMAAAPEGCGSFTVFTDETGRVVTFVDHPPDGISVGDQRVGVKTVKDADGNSVGELQWISTVRTVGDGQHQTSSEGTFIFPAGALFVKRLAASTLVAPDMTDKIAGNGDFIVIGGSGAFQGARGVAVRKASGVEESNAFEIVCD